MALFPHDTFRIRRISDEQRVVEAYGDLDLSTGPRLEEVLGTIGRPPVTDLELDLSGVPLVDAYAMRCIQRAARKLAQRGCRLRIGALRPAVAAVFDLVGFGNVVPIEPRSAAAPAGRDWSLPDQASRPA